MLPRGEPRGETTEKWARLMETYLTDWVEEKDKVMGRGVDRAGWGPGVAQECVGLVQGLAFFESLLTFKIRRFHTPQIHIAGLSWKTGRINVST